MYYSLKKFIDFVKNFRKFQLSNSQISKIKFSEEFLKKEIKKNRVIYGINTGFGPLANIRIPEKNFLEHQKNLVYHLASGVDKPYSEEESRSILLARIICLGKGYSGISFVNLEILINGFNQKLNPFIPSLGTVGASGDLTPLAHLALSFMGEGYFLVNGKKTYSKKVLLKNKIPILKLGPKDGLSIVNGTSVMTAISSLNIYYAIKAFDLSLGLSFFYAEILNAREENFSAIHKKVKLHKGISYVIEFFQENKKTSTRFRKNQNYLLKNLTNIKEDELFQDPYSIRTIPQILGGVKDFLDYSESLIEKELNSVSDNPIISDEIFHGGNFQGSHISIVSDLISISVINMANLVERMIARITDKNLNNGLPAFLQNNQNGLHSGFMGAQVTATSILAYMRSISTPASIQSISTNANNQDVVSMGTISANKSKELIEKYYYLITILAMLVTEAKEIILEKSKDKFSESSNKISKRVRKIVPSLIIDRSISQEIEKLSLEFKNN